MYEIDCHGMTTKEMLYFLENMDENIKKIKFITGVGNHSKKPIMDYYCTKEWKCPLKVTILNYIVYEKKQGSRIKELPGEIIWHIL